ncbi:hypothetical protein [Listeria riparia]|uniref:hypothetical protein n=1 Tax=Listeria riparia TaxID=1494964 RepID=UPI0004B23655|nr:hypothetical protein [Listeria riparia]
MKKLTIIILGILFLVSVILLWIYKPDISKEEINHPKKAIDVQKKQQFCEI